MYRFYSAIIGILITIMILFNGVLSQYAGNYTSTLIVHLLGFFAMLTVMLINKVKFRFDRTLPLYLYAGGALGVFTILFNNISFLQLGASLTLALGLLGQSIASIVVDHYGLLGMSKVKLKKEKLLGIAIISVGIIVMTLF